MAICDYSFGEPDTQVVSGRWADEKIADPHSFSFPIEYSFPNDEAESERLGTHFKP